MSSVVEKYKPVNDESGDDEVDEEESSQLDGSATTTAAGAGAGSSSSTTHLHRLHRRVTSGTWEQQSTKARILKLSQDIALFFSGQLILDPTGQFHIYWDWLVVSAVLFNIISVPWYLAFDPSLALTLLPLDMILLALMLMDILFVFRTGYQERGGNVVFDTARISSRYVRSSKFALDILSVLPIEFVAWAIPNAIGGDERLNVGFWFAVLKTKQVLRFHKLIDNSKLDRVFQTPRLRVFKVFIGWSLMAHFSASTFVFVAKHQPGGETNNWMIHADLDLDSRMVLYITSLYWAIATMSTVGFGDLFSVTSAEQTVASVTIVATLAFYAAVFTSTGAAISSLQLQARKYQKLMDSAKEYAAVNDLPSNLTSKMIEYEDYQWRSTHGFSARAMLHSLPLSVQTEVLLWINASLVQRVPYFKTLSKRFVEACILQMEQIVLLGGDYIIREGDQTREVYFIREGAVEVRADNPVTQKEDLVATLTPYSVAPYFGDVSAFLGITRTATVRAKRASVLYRIEAEDFFDVLSMFPEECQRFKNEAAKRLEHDFERVATAASRKNTERARKVKASLREVVTNRVEILQGVNVAAGVHSMLEFSSQNSPKSGQRFAPEAFTPSPRSEAAPMASGTTVPSGNILPDSTSQQFLSPPRRTLDELVSSDESVTIPLQAPHTPLPGTLNMMEESKENDSNMTSNTPPNQKQGRLARHNSSAARDTLLIDVNAESTSPAHFSSTPTTPSMFTPSNNGTDDKGKRRTLGTLSEETGSTPLDLNGTASPSSLSQNVKGLVRQDSTAKRTSAKSDLLNRLTSTTTRELLAESVAKAALAEAEAEAGPLSGRKHPTSPSHATAGPASTLHRLPSSSSSAGVPPAITSAGATPERSERALLDSKKENQLEDLAHLRSMRDSYKARNSLRNSEKGGADGGALAAIRDRLNPQAAAAADTTAAVPNVTAIVSAAVKPIPANVVANPRSSEAFQFSSLGSPSTLVKQSSDRAKSPLVTAANSSAAPPPLGHRRNPSGGTSSVLKNAGSGMTSAPVKVSGSSRRSSLTEKKSVSPRLAPAIPGKRPPSTKK